MGRPESKKEDDFLLKAGEEGICDKVSMVRSERESFGVLICGVPVPGEVGGDSL